MAEERVQRRLAAILAADVAGYSRLMGADEEGTLNTLNLYRGVMTKIIAEYQGRVVDTVGDSLLAEFGSAVQAVRSAVAVQRALDRHNADLDEARRMHFRIGINVGDVMVQGTNLIGDGVNIAARLQVMAQPGGICVSGSVQEHVGTKLRVRLEDLGFCEMKNIAKPIRVFRVGADNSESVARAVDHLPTQSKPSIAVLPFLNMSGDPKQRYFADGMTNDIITELSRYQGLFVIASHSVFALKRRQASVQDMGRDLGARYVVEGSVRRSGGSILVNVSLLETEGARCLWSERYEFTRAKLFALQDQIVREIVTRLSVRVEISERRRAARKEPRNLDAYDYYLRGREHWLGYSRDNNLQSQGEFEEAIRLDPTFARAYGQLSFALVQAYYCGWAQDPQTTLAQAYDLAQKAVALGGDDYDNYWSLAIVLLFRREHDRSIAFYERALAANPNQPNLLVDSAEALIYVGRAEEAIGRIREAVRFNPIHPDWYNWVLAFAFYHTGRYAEADAALKAIVNPPLFYRPLGIAILVRLDRREEAGAAVRELLRLDAAYTLAREDVLPYKRVEDQKAYVSSLREAGLT